MEFDVEFVKFTLIAIGTTFSTLSFYFLMRSKLIRLKLQSFLTVNDRNSPVARISVINFGERPIVVEAVRFPLLIWSEEPRLRVGGILKLLRGIESIFGGYSGSQYVSDSAVTYSENGTNRKLSQDERLIASIDLEGMMNNFFKSNETLGLSFYFFLIVITLKVEVHLSSGKVFSRNAHREIKWFLWKCYGRDKRFYQR